MYSIIRCQDKQYKVSTGDTIIVNKLDLEVGAEFVSNQVLLSLDKDKVLVGKPYLNGAEFKAKVLRQFRDDKILIFKKKRRHNYRRMRGHRQDLTELSITSITF